MSCFDLEVLKEKSKVQRNNAPFKTFKTMLLGQKIEKQIKIATLMDL
jgi:hypothetical protein